MYNGRCVNRADVYTDRVSVLYTYRRPLGGPSSELPPASLAGEDSCTCPLLPEGESVHLQPRQYPRCYKNNVNDLFDEVSKINDLLMTMLMILKKHKYFYVTKFHFSILLTI